jgi:uncharacterized protein YbjT (DUF2867 family)
MDTTRVALIAGATGLVGNLCLRGICASERYRAVIAWGRRTPDFADPKLQAIGGDLRHPEFAAYAPTDAFCALGTTIKVAGSEAAFRLVDVTYVTTFATAAKAAGVTRFVLVSALGADPQSRVFYNRVKGEAEAAIRALGFTTTVVLRPSLLVGARTTARSLERASIVAASAIAPLMVGPLRKYRPIQASLVASAMIEAALLAPPGDSLVESDRIGQKFDEQRALQLAPKDF